MLLIDFGNTHASFYKDKKVAIKDFILPQEKFYYINVNPIMINILQNTVHAVNLENFITLESNYRGLGVDRKLLCSYINDGVIVDAGSAITIDVMDNKKHKGGYILPGINAYYKAYENISEKLFIKRDYKSTKNIQNLPNNTKDAIEVGIIKSIVSAIKDISKDKKIYFCGGDGYELSQYFDNSIFNQDLIFEAMKKMIKDIKC